METVKIQVWDCLLHSKNSIYHHNHEQELFLQHTTPTKIKDMKLFFEGMDEFQPDAVKTRYFNYRNLRSKVVFSSGHLKRIFYFAYHDFIDPIHIKFKDYEYTLHPGHTRLMGKGMLDENFDPVRCVVYSEVGKKLLPVTGLEVQNKIEVIDVSAKKWFDDQILSHPSLVKRYSKKVDTHFKPAEEFYAEHTDDLYRIFFEDRHLFIFPHKSDFEYDKQYDINIEDFKGYRDALQYVFKKVKNGKRPLASQNI